MPGSEPAAQRFHAPPQRPPPAGCQWVARPEGPDWCAIDGEMLCRGRMPGKTPRYCRAPGVVSVNRPRWNPKTRDWGASWWGYCLEHGYGRWSSMGRVYCWRVAELSASEASTPATERTGVY